MICLFACESTREKIVLNKSSVKLSLEMNFILVNSVSGVKSVNGSYIVFFTLHQEDTRGIMVVCISNVL